MGYNSTSWLSYYWVLNTYKWLEETIILELWNRVKAVASTLECNWRLLFVNDGSTDNTLQILNQLCRQENRVDVIHLSRNFGHAAALSAGIDHSDSEAIILMDGDLQDRPEAIPDFVTKWKEGYKVVYAQRASRKENFIMQFFKQTPLFSIPTLHISFYKSFHID